MISCPNNENNDDDEDDDDDSQHRQVGAYHYTYKYDTTF